MTSSIHVQDGGWLTTNMYILKLTTLCLFSYTIVQMINGIKTKESRLYPGKYKRHSVTVRISCKLKKCSHKGF